MVSNVNGNWVGLNKFYPYSKQVFIDILDIYFIPLDQELQSVDLDPEDIIVLIKVVWSNEISTFQNKITYLYLILYTKLRYWCNH